MANWTDADISALVQRVEDLETELGAVSTTIPGYHEWKFDHGIWKCKHCPATRICDARQQERK